MTENPTPRATRGRWIAAAASLFGITCAVIAFAGAPGWAYAVAAMAFGLVVVLLTTLMR